MKSMENKTTGAEEIHWDLSDLYLGIDDLVYFKDQENVLQSAQSFAKQYRGRIAELDATEFLGLLKEYEACLLYTSPSPRDEQSSRMPSSA